MSGVAFLLLAGVGISDEAALLAEVGELQNEGTRWFNVAGNTDLSHAERNKARKKAYDILREAYAKLDAHVTDHPERAEALEDRMVEIHMMIYWIRKESPLGLLSGENPEPVKPAVRPESEPEPEPPEARDPGPGPHAGPPEPIEPDPADVFRAAEAYERQHPADIAGALERYRAFLARFPDPGSELFSKALERSSVLNERLKDAYRKLRQEDPDTLDAKRFLSKEEKNLLNELARGLRSSNDEERRRAAIDLGLLGSSEGSYPLILAMGKEDVPEVEVAIRDALVKIGGKQTAELLGHLVRDRDTEDLLRAVELLAAIGRRDAVQGRYAGLALAPFVLSRDGDVADRAYQILKSFGRDGGSEGLCEALGESRAPIQYRVLIIRALAEIKDPRAAGVLGRFLRQKGNVKLREEAMNALGKIGIDAAPYLFPFLRSPATKAWTALTLRRITGQQLGSRQADWAAWWRRYQAARELRGR